MILRNSKLFTLLLSFVLLSTYSFSSEGSSPLQKGKWVKVKVDKSGVYKITYDDLINWGFSSPQNVQVFGNGGAKIPTLISADDEIGLKETALYLDYGSDGVWNSGDFVAFYAEGPDVFKRYMRNDDDLFYSYFFNEYCRESYYFVTCNQEEPLKVAAEDNADLSTDYSVSGLDYFAGNEYNEKNLIKSGNKWVTDFDKSFSVEFSFPELVDDSKILFHSGFLLKANNSATLRVYANGDFNNSVATSPFDESEYIDNYSHNLDGEVLATSNLELEFTFSEDEYNTIMGCDYIYVNARRKPFVTYGQQLVMDQKANDYSVAEYNINANKEYVVWDVTDNNNPKELSTTYSGGELQFKTNGAFEHRLWLFEMSNLYSPVFVESVDNQDLEGLEDVDMVIISSDELRSEAERIAELHKNEDGLSVFIVNQKQIFNEFSSGRPDIGGIRAFMKCLYEKPDSRLKYLLLFGDGQYDNRKFDASSNLIMTYQSLQSSNSSYSFTSDDYYCIFGDGEGVKNMGDFVGDMAISVGRMPVNDVEEAKVAADKLYAYYNAKENLGYWCNNVCFVADDADAKKNVPEVYHTYHSEDYANVLLEQDPRFHIDKVYLEAYDEEVSVGGQRYPSAEKSISDAIKEGVLLLSFSGHGSIDRMTQEVVLSNHHVDEWKNIDKLPVVITASCEISTYDQPDDQTLGEKLFRQPDGGAIALLTTARTVFAQSNWQLGMNLFTHIANPNYCLGDALRVAKNNTQKGVDFKQNKRKFVLLGDPALRLHLPKQKVILSSINDIPKEDFQDTIKAMDKVTLKGYVGYDVSVETTYVDTVYSGDSYTVEHIDTIYTTVSLDSAYNGVVYVSLYDKKRTITAEGKNATVSYSDQTNIVYKGKASVEKGEFVVEFVAPKDILPFYGASKLVFIANDSSAIAGGHVSDIVLGGKAEDVVVDDEGPEIELFINDTTFVDGGLTDESPILLVKIKDESGVNLASGAIGHDAVAVVDENWSEMESLNGYYETELNTYKKGWIKYPLNELEEGRHEVMVRVWDVANNASEEYISFYVSSSASLAIDQVMNYPNPVSNYTKFYFEHNQQNVQLEYTVSVYNMAGSLVAEISENVDSDSFRVGPVEWQADDIAPGIYKYTITVKVGEEEAVGQNSLVILR